MINNRVFGDDIPRKVKEKLKARQALAKGAKPNESIQMEILDEENKWITEERTISDILDTKRFDGQVDLSSRTPFIRLWTAVQVSQIAHGGGKDGVSKSTLDLTN